MGILRATLDFTLTSLARLYFAVLFHPPSGCLRLRLLGSLTKVYCTASVSTSFAVMFLLLSFIAAVKGIRLRPDRRHTRH